MINFIFLGKPASGKGTQSELLSKSHNIPLIIASKLLKEYSQTSSDVAQQVLSIMKSGDLIPDGLVMWILKERLEEIDFSNGVIFDGVPRNVDQAIEFDMTLQEIEQPDYLVFDIYISDESVIKRITGRRVCKNNSQHVYHLQFNPPASDGVCDHCGGELYQREDDSEEKAHHRLDIYNEETRALVDFFKPKGLLYEVDGEESIEKIHDTLVNIVDTLRRT